MTSHFVISRIIKTSFSFFSDAATRPARQLLHPPQQPPRRSCPPRPTGTSLVRVKTRVLVGLAVGPAPARVGTGGGAAAAGAAGAATATTMGEGRLQVPHRGAPEAQGNKRKTT